MSIVGAFLSSTSDGMRRVSRIFRDEDNNSSDYGEYHQRQQGGQQQQQHDFVPVNDATRLMVHTTVASHTHNTTTQDDAEQQQQQQDSLTTGYQGFDRSNRAVRLFLFHAIVYYSLAAAGYSFLVYNWPLVDSLYFATTLFTTIGFGDLAPATVSGRVYTMFLTIYGVVILGIFLGVLGENLVEQRSEAVHEQRRKVGTQVLHSLKTDPSKIERPEEVLSASVLEQTRERSLWEDIRAIAVLEAPIVTVLVLIGLGVGYVEGWTILESVYWLVISGTTVGLGDFHPNLPHVKLFCCIFLPFAVAVLGHLLGRIASLYMDRKRRLAEKKFLSRSLTLCDLATMDTDSDGRVDKAEFLCYMLTALQKVSKEDVREIEELFHKLDADGTQYLTKEDLIAKDWDSTFRTSFTHSLD